MDFDADASSVDGIVNGEILEGDVGGIGQEAHIAAGRASLSSWINKSQLE
jgi:hypothetical protein